MTQPKPLFKFSPELIAAIDNLHRAFAEGMFRLGKALEASSAAVREAREREAAVRRCEALGGHCVDLPRVNPEAAGVVHLMGVEHHQPYCCTCRTPL